MCGKGVESHTERGVVEKNSQEMIIQIGKTVVEWIYHLGKKIKNEQSTTNREGTILH